jgi:hypothetical protein
VSPRYQHELRIEVRAEADRVTLEYHSEGAYQGSDPGRDVDFSREVPRALYRQFWEVLLQQDVLQLGKDIIGAARRERVGVSYNHFELQAGGRPLVRFEYLLSQLAIADPGLSPFQAVVAAVKQLGLQVEAIGEVGPKAPPPEAKA